MHWVEPWQEAWVEAEVASGARIVAVELADDAVPLARLEPASERTIVLLGHEHHGVPQAMLDLADIRVEIPPASASGRARRRPCSAGGLITASLGGVGHSLDVAVAGSLVAYRLAGLA